MQRVARSAEHLEWQKCGHAMGELANSTRASFILTGIFALYMVNYALGSVALLIYWGWYARPSGDAVTVFMFLLLFGVYFLRHYITYDESAPRLLQLIPELAILILIPFAIARLDKSRTIFICTGAVVLFVSSLLVGNGVLVALNGVRVLFRFMPFYMIFSAEASNGRSDKFKYFMSCVLILAVIQIVPTLAQYLSYDDPDFVAGTMPMAGSGILSIFQIIIITWVLLLAWRGAITRRKALVFSFVCMLPCFINETKITVFLMARLCLTEL